MGKQDRVEDRSLNLWLAGCDWCRSGQPNARLRVRARTRGSAASRGVLADKGLVLSARIVTPPLPLLWVYETREDVG